MGLIDELKANDKKGLFVSNNEYVSYSTGLLPLDYANGYWKKIIKADGTPDYIPMVGIPAGSITTVIGSTGTGKTTMAVGMGWGIVRKFEDGLLVLVDAEKGAFGDRIFNVTGVDPTDPRIQLHKDSTTIEDVLSMVDEICETKERGGKKYKYDVPYAGVNGTTASVYVPTVIVIDSLPSFNSKEFDDKTLGGNIDGMRGAKDVSRFFTNILDKSWKYNIIWFIINHIRPKAEMNPYAGTPNGLMMLKQGEQLPRGAVAQYYSNTFFRISARKSDNYLYDEMGFEGRRCTLQLAKSRSNQVGTSFPVAFIDGRFDSTFTVFEYLNAIGLIKGRNPYLYIEGYDNIKFNRKDFRAKMSYEPAFRQMALEVMAPYMLSLLGPKPRIEDTEQKLLGYGELELPISA
ncbi:MAG: hypothetical protein NC548_05895 [Lachnospiraceae bacterium]|nr:hypothetical protein [Lachnospiraceae bacterium]